jgi:monovalent cation:H+ antiporter-2, CPA2 family
VYKFTGIILIFWRGGLPRARETAPEVPFPRCNENRPIKNPGVPLTDIVFIRDIIIILLVSIPIVFLFSRIRIPSIVGFLIAGMIIGPSGFRLITDLDIIEMLATFGVILLLFTIGLELSIQRLLQMRRVLFITGGVQVGLTIVIFTILLQIAGLPLNQSLFLAMLGAGSSTAVVLKILSDNKEVNSQHGRIATGVTIFQDLASVPMILLIPVLATTGEYVDGGQVIRTLLLSFGGVAVIVVVARYLMPRIIYYLATARVREAFTIGTMMLVFGTAYLTNLAGVSLALGAFITGIILSESEFNRQVFADAIPLRDAFNSIFFVSIGLLLNIGIVFDHLGIFTLVVLAIIVIKSSIIIITIVALKFPFKTGLIAGLSLAQIGEFSFVLALVGLDNGLIGPELYNAFLAASIFTLLLVPVLVYVLPLILDRYSAAFRNIHSEHIGPIDTHIKHHVIIVGYGLNGENLARVLKNTGIPYIVIDMDPETVSQLMKKDELVIFGDVTKPEILEQASITTAQCIVFAMADVHATRLGLILAKKTNPSIFTVVRLRELEEIDEFIKLGADEIIPEEFETSLQIFSKVLETYHIPLNIIMKQIAIVRSEAYRLLRRDGPVKHQFSRLNEILAAGITETYFVVEDNPHVGETIRDLDIRAITGATIIAIVRSGRAIPNPSPNEPIRGQDTLVLVGDHKAVDDAIQFLNGEKNLR